MKDESQKGFSFTAHNFEAMNKAIDTEVEKRFEITELYQNRASSKHTLMMLHIILSLAVITLTAAIVYWLYSQGSGSFVIPSTNTVNQGDGLRDRNTYSALNTLSEQEQSSQADQGFINTSFTVFHRTLLPTGEYAVTGKTFQPSDLQKPSEQYCYLEKNQSDENLSAIPLAVIENNKFILETEKPELIGFAKRYCQFSF